MKSLTRRGFLKSSLVLSGVVTARKFLYAQSGTENSVARYFTREMSKLKLLAVTDLHFFDSTKPKENNEKTVQALKALVERFKPELLLINGDMWYEDIGGKAFDHAQWAVDQISQLGLPWIFNFGNHDAIKDFKSTYELLTNAPHSLFRGANAYGNYRVEIWNQGAKAPFWIFFIINDYFPERGFNQYQINWFNAEVARVKQKYTSPPSAFLFIHIPLPQFNDLWKSGRAKGIKNEPVMYEGGTKRAFSVIKGSGIIKAVFAGHDHVNNYYGELEGIQLHYLRATGYGGYGGEKVKKGATIISLDLAQIPEFDSLVVFEDGSVWNYGS